MNTILEPNVVPIDWTEKLNDGSHVIIRPIRGEDAELERELLEHLSEESLRMRFLGHTDALSDSSIHRLTNIDWAREAALVALVHRDGRKQEVGVARFAIGPDFKTCECAVTVRDDWQSRGLGTALMRHLIEFARQRGMAKMVSYDDARNTRMHDLAIDLGFTCRRDPSDPTVEVHELAL